ncbi:MAG: hypothetical protein ACREB3_17145, partial [Burkholderiales bacterium]
GLDKLVNLQHCGRDSLTLRRGGTKTSDHFTHSGTMDADWQITFNVNFWDRHCVSKRTFACYSGVT